MFSQKLYKTCWIPVVKKKTTPRIAIVAFWPHREYFAINVIFTPRAPAPREIIIVHSEKVHCKFLAHKRCIHHWLGVLKKFLNLF